MTVYEFTRMSEGGEIFKIVDADLSCSRSNPQVIVSGDKNVVRVHCGHRIVQAFANETKKTVILYTKEA